MAKNKFQFPDVDFDPSYYDAEELKEKILNGLEKLAKKQIISPEEYRWYVANVDLWVIHLMEIEQ